MSTLSFANQHNMIAVFCQPVQIHACVDGQKIIVTEAFVREVLHLRDVNGIDNLPDSTIFENL
ncbi:hypothetical protein CTI12_AA529870 [Artemisia annua]|uniref:Uncharacterized protein n=1 Tax=Artemisia annua TaxID=35608 RepID=A0A2U1L4L4_ARTAN|nr:hypothetical protein CTI12_AA529870 [Artemisia annua]